MSEFIVFCSMCTILPLKKFTFAILSVDELLVLFVTSHTSWLRRPLLTL